MASPKLRRCRTGPKTASSSIEATSTSSLPPPAARAACRARRRGHEQPPPRLDLARASRIVVNSLPTRPAQRWASSAIGEVKAGRPALVGGGDLRRGLVGGEHDPPPAAAQEAGDQLRVGRDRHAQLGGVRDELVLARHRLVRADREVVERLGGVGAPLPQRLRQQRERGDQDQRPLRVQPLGDPHRRQRLAGPAGHDSWPRSVRSNPFTVALIASRTCGNGFLRAGRRGRSSSGDAGHATCASSSCERSR